VHLAVHTAVHPIGDAASDDYPVRTTPSPAGKPGWPGSRAGRKGVTVTLPREVPICHTSLSRAGNR
jgi:hypothetical protein